MATDYGHWNRFNLDKRLIFETRSWLVVTRPHQITLGSCVLLLKRPVTAIREVKSAEFNNLRVAIRRYEQLVDHAFGPTKYNYVISGQKDPFVHLHAIPRYDQTAAQRFAEHDWHDSDWPFFPDFPRTLVPTDGWLLDEVTKTLHGGVKRWLRR